MAPSTQKSLLLYAKFGNFVVDTRAWGDPSETAAATAKIPSNISYDEASTVPLAFATAYVGLYSNGIGLVPPVTPKGRGEYAGNPIILGGSSSVCQNAVQLAKLSGFSPIITTASLKHAESLKYLGATHVIDRNISYSVLASEIASITQNRLLKYAVDSISSADTQQAAYELLAPRGQLAVVLPVAVKTTEEKHISRAIGVINYPSNVNTLFHGSFEGLLKEGVIKPNRVEVLPDGLAGIPGGLKRLETNQVSRSKLVAHPQETT